MEGIKILILGPSGVGKTTLKQVFFDQDNPLKLLTESLEPTYGVDTKLYDFGRKIAVHDLAGQQLEEFLSTQVEVFAGCDLILLIVDCREDWEKNNELINRIDEIRKLLCADAFLTIFFHKSDLLPLPERKALDLKIATRFAGKTNLFAQLTSITPEFFSDAFRYFVFILQRCLFRVDSSISKDFFIKLNIINHFIEKNIVTFAELASKVGISAEELQANILDLERKGYLIFKDKLKQVQLSEIGQTLVQTVKEGLYLKIQESLGTTIEFVKGFILSDKSGKIILCFESEPNFFENMAGNVQNRPDASLISMFLSAIGNFGEAFDSIGFSSISLFGKNLQFHRVLFGDIAGIFIINNLQVDKPIENSLRQFLNEIFAEFRPELQQFIEKGASLENSPLKAAIVPKIKKLNEVLQNLALLKRQFSRDKLGALYQKIQRQEFSVSDLNTIKPLLFYYLIAEDPSIMNEIYKMLQGVDLKELLK